MPDLEDIRSIFTLRGKPSDSDFKKIRKIFTPEKSSKGEFEELKRIFTIK